MSRKTAQNISDTGIDFIASFEGCRLTAYHNSSREPWTIGYGNTTYENGKKVQKGDKISAERAKTLFKNKLLEFSSVVNSLLTTDTTQNQFDALVSLAYNIGLGNLKRSTVLKMVNDNPNNPDISKRWVLWLSKDIKFRNGLLRRRNAEVKLYFSSSFFPFPKGIT